MPIDFSLLENLYEKLRIYFIANSNHDLDPDIDLIPLVIGLSLLKLGLFVVISQWFLYCFHLIRLTVCNSGHIRRDFLGHKPSSRLPQIHIHSIETCHVLIFGQWIVKVTDSRLEDSSNNFSNS